MSPHRDPAQRADDGSTDLQEVATWRPESRLDRLLAGLARRPLAAVVPLSLAVLASQFALSDVDGTVGPAFGPIVVLSVGPALLLAASVWYADVTTRARPRTLALTFLVALALAPCAALVNGLFGNYLRGVLATLGAGDLLTAGLVFFLVVGPAEELVKLAAVWLYPARRPSFDAVIDGAVYGAVAGLGFATIENAVYLFQGGAGPATGALLDGELVGYRAMAGPGHVVYSAFAGYYLGLARFNRRWAVPLVAKGLLVAVTLHATYNLAATYVGPLVEIWLGVGDFAAALTVTVAVNGTFALVLGYKLSRYAAAYRNSDGADQPPAGSELTEFDP